MSLSTDYRGYKITYSENAGDEWCCYDLGKVVTNKTLSGCKAAIDKLLLDVRKAASLKCFELSTTGKLEVNEAVIIEYEGPQIEGGPGSWSGKPKHIAGQKVYSMARRSDADRASRSRRDISQFAPFGPDTDAAIAEVKRLEVILKDATKARDAAIAAIPRLSIDDIAELVRVSGIDPTGGIKEPGVADG
jgi:hypothetical protein